MTQFSKFYKDDADKPDLSLLPYNALTQAAYASMFGAKKYGRDNWKRGDNKADTVHRFIAAALRHLHQRASGEQHDNETGLDHLAHAAISCLYALELTLSEEYAEA
jgi:hypothetical protein